ncbi:MAG: histidine--tRNA ligase [Candidatus Latescibacteria bacterium]|nr:histidine--tRNA ligase [Candidatus Latescibacterota bacterium]
MILSNPKGTQDFLPPYGDQKALVENEFRKVVSLYGFSEIVNPTFEHTELYLRSTGLTTDIVTKQMYTFTDKGNRELALRPEGTPGVVRAVLQNKLKLPVRLFYIGPMFRYERPQKGRYREFFQLGVEVIGESEPETDVEIIEMGMRFFNQINLSDLIVKVNSVGCPICRPKFRVQLRLFLDKNLEQICDDCKIRVEQNPMRVFDCKVEKCKEIYHDAPKISDNLCYDCQNHFQAVLKELNERKIPFELDKMMVRGLDYYTRTAFEFVPTGSSELGSQDSVGGGGRYDNLVEDFGGPKTPAIGFALGLDRILICLGNALTSRKLVYIIALDAQALKQGRQLLDTLRNAEIPALINPPDKNLRAALGIADNLSCEYVIIIGANEMQKKVYTLKNLTQRSQQEIPQDKIVEVLSKK